MTITFLMPGYHSLPSGGFRIIYEYANRLVARGHQVTVLHPRRLKYLPPATFNAYRWVRGKGWALTTLFRLPKVDWHVIDPRVRLRHIPNSHARYVPQADVLFATGWPTVRSVLECPPDRGEKIYLIQGYEVYHASKNMVDAGWRAPLHKIVVAKWLLEIGQTLGCQDLTYIPNAIDHERYRMIRPIANRSRQISMVFSKAPVKGCLDAFRALEIVREKYSDLKVVAFGASRGDTSIPRWIKYRQNPPQDVLVEQIYNQSSIFLSASLSEGFSLPPAEAAACGCAVVVTDSGGVREYVQNGVTGLLSPVNDPSRLAENLCALLGNEQLRVRLATAGHERVHEFNWDRSAALMEGYIRQMCRVPGFEARRVAEYGGLSA
jgi:L-malate glycosyltransferase